MPGVTGRDGVDAVRVDFLGEMTDAEWAATMDAVVQVESGSNGDGAVVERRR